MSLSALDGTVALDDVQRVEDKRANTAGTIGLVVGGLVAAFGVLALVFSIGCATSDSCGND